ncbi:hypothetical protein [Streptomyces sp. NPDC056491]|uniref:hypothetical protein n=1 Tax=Streptomyces sp. NPDC056491 TaxID=3345837 RepID=UPI0036C5161B
MTSISAGTNAFSGESSAAPARSLRRGLVIQNLEAVPENALADSCIIFCTSGVPWGVQAAASGRLAA